MNKIIYIKNLINQNEKQTYQHNLLSNWNGLGVWGYAIQVLDKEILTDQSHSLTSPAKYAF